MKSSALVPGGAGIWRGEPVSWGQGMTESEQQKKVAGEMKRASETCNTVTKDLTFMSLHPRRR